MIRSVYESYRMAGLLFDAFLSTHLFIRLVSAAILLPLIGALMQYTIGFSQQSALTDQDIARFLLTPTGAIGGLAVAALFLAALVLDVAVMTATLRSAESRPLAALRAGAGFAIAAWARLTWFALALVLRLLAIVLPFTALAGLIYATRLTQFDINYYLTNRPPEFVLWGGVIALVALAMVGLLLVRLLGWAVALHLVLFAGLSPTRAFGESRRRMRGAKSALFRALLAWGAVRLALGSAVGLMAAALLVLASNAFRGDLIEAAIAVTAVLALALVATTCISALSNGALADLLNTQFDRVSEGAVTPIDPLSAGRHRPRLRGAALLGLIAAGVLAFGSMGVGLALVERVSADTTVEIIAHRGGAIARPENTLAAMEKGIEDGADWLEIDVQETADGEVIVAHDSDFMKSAGVDLKVWDATMEDIARIDIGSTFDPAFADQRPPRLSEVLTLARDRARVIIELKYYGHDVALEERVIAIVEELGMSGQIATMSLKYPAVQKMRRLRPDWRTGVLAATSIGDLSRLEGDFLALNMASVTVPMIARAQAAGKEIYVWTVNDAAAMSRMISMGVDGLITDDPGLAREVIDDRNALPTAARLALWLADTFGVAADRMLGVEVEQ